MALVMMAVKFPIGCIIHAKLNSAAAGSGYERRLRFYLRKG